MLIETFLKNYLYSQFIKRQQRLGDIDRVDILFTTKYLIIKTEGDFSISTQVINLYTQKITEFTCIFSLDQNYDTEITKYIEGECEINSTEAPVVPETYQYVTEGKCIPDMHLHSVRGQNILLIVDKLGHMHLYY